VLDLEIDFVRLRHESYAGTNLWFFSSLYCRCFVIDTRIPNIKHGTAEEDALRRDFTINSLFYNINQGIVEDFTGQGLPDLLNSKYLFFIVNSEGRLLLSSFVRDYSNPY
jgi:tRNA nucleotidyltransferase/poly(A) polymerase